MGFYFGSQEVSSIIAENGQGGTGAEYKSSLMATTTQSAYSPSIVSLSDYVLPDYTIKKEQTGLLYPKREKEEAKVSKNFTNRNCTIQNGIASGFSSTNYIEVDKPFQPGTKNWKIVVRAQLTTINGLNRLFGCINNWYNTPALESDGSLNIGCGISDSTSNWGITWLNSGTNVFKVNEWCFLKVEYKDRTYSLSKSEDGIVWDTLASYASEKIVYQTNTPILVFGTYNHRSDAWSGLIDLNNTYIEVDDEMYWQPYTVKETDEYDSSNIEKIGTGLSISDSNFVLGFNFDNYLKFTHNLTEPIRNLDLIIKGRVSTDNTYQVGIEFRGTSVDWAQWVKIYSGNKLGVLTVGNADSGGFTVLNGVDYWFRCVGTENTFTLYCKRYDGLSIEETKNQEDWTQVFQTSIDKCIGQGINTFTFGRNNNSSYSTQYWRGGFDLKNFQFIINDEIVCGYNKHLKGICTKDFIPQVGTNTLNAYHIEYTDGTSECLLGQTEPTGEDIKSVQLLESGLTFEEDKSWTYNEDLEIFE